MNDDTKDHLKLCTGIVLGIYTVLFVLGCVENEKVRESRGVIALFAIPWLVQLVGLINLYFKPRQEADKVRTFSHVYWITMGLCAVFNCSLWLYYLKGGRAETASYCALAFILILLLFVVVVTFAVLTPPSGKSEMPRAAWRKSAVEKLLALREGVSHMPFWALLHFLTVFLTVSFLFGFAFAFHDQSVDITQKPYLPPLYMANLPTNEKSQSPAATASAEHTNCVNFYFPDNEASLEKFDGETVKGVEVLIEDGKDIIKDKAVPGVERGVKNHKSMEVVTKLILEITQNAQLAHVRLIGHADSRPTTGGPYPNNYALSQARVDTVRTEMLKEIYKNDHKWRNIEWIFLPISSDKYPEARNFMEKVCTPPIKEDRVVQVSVTAVSGGPSEEILRRSSSDNFKPLALMDYMYFAIYTITTTGYGDIMPTTNYAKALTCFANICEMFFIIGLFNALVALKDTRKRGDDLGSRDDDSRNTTARPASTVM